MGDTIGQIRLVVFLCPSCRCDGRNRRGGGTIGDWSTDHGYYLYFRIGGIKNDA